jgi:hypothetical protein
VARAGSSGGRRQGTPGKTYGNRTDLNVNYGQSKPGASVASGGMVAPPPQQPQQAQQQGPLITPDHVPALDDPTSRPNEPVTHGLDSGAGAGVEALGVMPGNPAIADVRAAYLRNPTPELRRVLAMIANQGLT